MVTTATFAINVELDEDQPVVTLRGAVEASGASEMLSQLRPVAELAKPVLLDLGEVESLDADGCAPLLELCRRHPGPVVIIAASAAAARAISQLELPANLTVAPAGSPAGRSGTPRPHRSALDCGPRPVPSHDAAQLRDEPAVATAQLVTRGAGRATGVAGATWLGRNLRGCTSLEEMTNRIVELAPTVTGCQSATLISALAREARTSRSAPVNTFLNELAADCLAAEHDIVVPQVTSDRRWHAYGSLRLAGTDGQAVPGSAAAWFLPNGAGRRPAALVLDYAAAYPDDDALRMVDEFAEVCDVALAHQHALEQLVSLRAALDSNREIGTAMGILMASRKISAEEAFALLRSVSQRAHRKLNAIAADVVETGTIPS